MAVLGGTMQLTDGERGRLDRSRRRPADGLAALDLTNARNCDWNLLRPLFGETPNSATRPP